MIFQSVSELDDNLREVFSFDDENITVRDEEKLHEFGIDYLIYSAVLSDDAQTRHLCRVYIRKLAKSLGIFPASIYPLYRAFGEGEVKGFTVPAMNMRAITYDVAREVFKKATEHAAGAFIFELSRSEAIYTNQNQDEVAVCVLAAAIKEGYVGPVFLQGDHYQFDTKKFKEYPQGQIDEIELAVKDALAAGFYNIDIDASTLVDLSLPEKADQQKNNFEMTSVVTKFIRSMQPAGVTVTIGGEIGHIGDVNSDVEDFDAFMTGYIDELGSNDIQIISKVSVQTGTSHGGTPNPDGTLKEVNVDFGVLESIGKVAREKYGMAGPVQHGASTLPHDMFGKFPEVGTVEIHLATGFLTIVYENMSEATRNKLYEYVRSNFSDEKEEGWTDEQFIYKLRKKAIGPNKKDLWLMDESEKENIRAKLAEELEILFQKLNIVGSLHTVNKYVGEPTLLS
jgi:fructose/tagatose bisphosphate aldolase